MIGPHLRLILPHITFIPPYHFMCVNLPEYVIDIYCFAWNVSPTFKDSNFTLSFKIFALIPTEEVSMIPSHTQTLSLLSGSVKPEPP